MKKTGERQVASNLENIRNDHKLRYEWAIKDLKEGLNVVDAGCGVGYGSFMLSQHSKTVTGVDVDSNAIEFAEQNWKTQNIKFVTSDLLMYDTENTVDFITAFEVIEHVTSPKVYLRKLNTLLSSGGNLYISVPNESVISHSIELNPFHLRHYNENIIVSLCQEAGFEVIEVQHQDAEGLVEKNGKYILLSLKKKFEVEPINGEDFELLYSECYRQLHKRSDVIAGLKSQIKKMSDLDAKRLDAIQKLKNELSSIRDKADTVTKEKLVAAAKLEIIENTASDLAPINTQLNSLASTLDSVDSFITKLGDLNHTSHDREFIDQLSSVNSSVIETSSVTLQLGSTIGKLKESIDGIHKVSAELVPSFNTTIENLKIEFDKSLKSNSKDSLPLHNELLSRISDLEHRFNMHQKSLEIQICDSNKLLKDFFENIKNEKSVFINELNDKNSKSALTLLAVEEKIDTIEKLIANAVSESSILHELNNLFNQASKENEVRHNSQVLLANKIEDAVKIQTEIASNTREDISEAISIITENTEELSKSIVGAFSEKLHESMEFSKLLENKLNTLERTQELDAKKDELDIYKAEVEALTKSVNELSLEHQSLVEDKLALIDSNERTNQSADLVKRTAEKRIELTEQLIIREKVRNSKQSKENSSLKVKNKNFESAVSRLNKELAFQTKKVTKQQKSIESFRNNKVFLEKKLASLKAEFQRVIKKNEKLTSKYDKDSNAIAANVRTTLSFAEINKYSKSKSEKVRMLFQKENKAGSLVKKLYDNKLFDPVWYVTNYPDSVDYELGPCHHFVYHGFDEARNPSAKINTAKILRDNGISQEAGLDAFIETASKFV